MWIITLSLISVFLPWSKKLTFWFLTVRVLLIKRDDLRNLQVVSWIIAERLGSLWRSTWSNVYLFSVLPIAFTLVFKCGDIWCLFWSEDACLYPDEVLETESEKKMWNKGLVCRIWKYVHPATDTVVPFVWRYICEKHSQQSKLEMLHIHMHSLWLPF